jgi:tRNA(adenine34) deaminase
MNTFGLNHKPEIYAGVMEEECAALLSSFFAELRERRKMLKKAKNDENPQKIKEKFEK